MGIALGWLARPLTLAGLVVLLVNDHVLKAAYPGVVTGKLSDFAGMLMFPPLLAVLLGAVAPRVPYEASIFLAGLGFAAVNVGDPADLIALPMLYVSWRELKRARPIAGRRHAAILVLIGLAATLATSKADVTDPATLGVGKSGFLVWTIEVDTRTGEPIYLSSEDSGRTFRPDRPSEPVRPSEQDCLGQTCYRVVRGEMHVQQSNDGGTTWATAWRVGGGQYHDLVTEYRGVSPSSRSLTVLDTPGGHVVLVANGRDGLLRRDESGTWTRMGRPARLSQGLLPGGGTPFAVTGVVALLLFGAVGSMTIRAGGPRWILLFEAGALALAIGCAAIVHYGESVPAFAVMGVSILAVVMLAACTRLRRMHPGWAAAVAGITAATATLVELARRAYDDDFFGDAVETGQILLVLLVGFVLAALAGLGAAGKGVELGSRPVYRPPG